MTILLTLAAMGLLAATAAGSLPLRGFFFDTAAHFMLPYGLAAAGLLAVSLLVSPIPAAIAAISFGLALYKLAPFLLPVWRVKAPASQIRILQANTLFLNKDVDGLMKVINAHKPDIILVQEANSATAALFNEIAKAYPHQSLRVSDSVSYGLAAASNLAFTHDEAFDPVESRATAQHLRVVKDGHAIDILSIHTDNPLAKNGYAVRSAEFNAAAAWAKAQKNAHVISGDFNMTPYTQGYRELIRETGLKNARRGSGVHGTYPTRLPAVARLPIDHTLHSKEFSVTDFRTLEISGSDHLATLVTLARRA